MDTITTIHESIIVNDVINVAGNTIINDKTGDTNSKKVEENYSWAVVEDILKRDSLEAFHEIYLIIKNNISITGNTILFDALNYNSHKIIEYIIETSSEQIYVYNYVAAMSILDFALLNCNEYVVKKIYELQTDLPLKKYKFPIKNTPFNFTLDRYNRSDVLTINAIQRFLLYYGFIFDINLMLKYFSNELFSPIKCKNIVYPLMYLVLHMNKKINPIFNFDKTQMYLCDTILYAIVRGPQQQDKSLVCKFIIEKDMYYLTRFLKKNNLDIIENIPYVTQFNLYQQQVLLMKYINDNNVLCLDSDCICNQKIYL